MTNKDVAHMGRGEKEEDILGPTILQIRVKLFRQLPMAQWTDCRRAIMTASWSVMGKESVGFVAPRDARGNVTGEKLGGGALRTGRTLTYTTFNKVSSIVKGHHTGRFAYGPARARFMRTDTDDKTITTLYVQISNYQIYRERVESRYWTKLKKYKKSGIECYIKGIRLLLTIWKKQKTSLH